jgi:hypothetical protein
MIYCSSGSDFGKAEVPVSVPDQAPVLVPSQTLFGSFKKIV